MRAISIRWPSSTCCGTTLRIVRSTGTTSIRSPGPALLCQGCLGLECVEDDADEQSFEAADRFAAAFAFGAFASEVGAGAGVGARLGDRDSVERCVELAVAAAVEPV